MVPSFISPPPRAMGYPFKRYNHYYFSSLSLISFSICISIRSLFCFISGFPSLLLFFCIIMLFPIISATGLASFPSLRFVSLDANGLAHEMKISAIENMVKPMQPHALVIGESKNSHQVARWLSLRGYQLYENPGRSTGHKSAKWGVIVALSSWHPPKVLYVNALLPWTYPFTQLTARLSHIALLESTPLEIPAVQKMMKTSFGHSLLTLCNEAPYSCQSHTGDINACLPFSETTSSSLSASRTFCAHFAHFL